MKGRGEDPARVESARQWHLVLAVAGVVACVALNLALFWMMPWWRIALVYVVAFVCAMFIESANRTSQLLDAQRVMRENRRRAEERAKAAVALKVPERPCDVCMDDDERDVRGIAEAKHTIIIKHEMDVCDRHLTIAECDCEVKQRTDVH